MSPKNKNSEYWRLPPDDPNRKALDAVAKLEKNAHIPDVEHEPLHDDDYHELLQEHHRIPHTAHHEQPSRHAIDDGGVNVSGNIEHYEVLDGTEEIRKATSKGNNLILNTVVGWVVYIILIFAIFLFWMGHNAPGGGFIAGLMCAAVVVLLYVSFGSNFIKNTLRFDFKYLIGIGLTFSLGCGLGGMFFGDPFLTHTFAEFHLGALGHLELATATIFDLGVFLTVTGGCVTIITSIGESASRRSLVDIAEEARETDDEQQELDR